MRNGSDGETAMTRMRANWLISNYVAQSGRLTGGVIPVSYFAAFISRWPALSAPLCAPYISQHSLLMRRESIDGYKFHIPKIY